MKRNPKNFKLLIILTSIGSLLLIALLTYIGLFINKKLESKAFNNDDWNYMISYIENKYGNGEEFIVFKKETDSETKSVRGLCGSSDYEYMCDEQVKIGYKATIIGNFEGDKKGYLVTFKRYYRDSPYKEGNNVIIHTGVNSSYSIDEYKGTK